MLFRSARQASIKAGLPIEVPATTINVVCGSGLKAVKDVYKRQERAVPEEVLRYRRPVDVREITRDVTMEDLNRIFQFVMRKREDKIDPIRSKFGEIKQEEVRLEDKMEEVEYLISSRRRMSFRQLLEGQMTKEKVVVTFLSVLELMKVGKIRAVQEKIGQEIIIEVLERHETETGSD